MKKLIIAGFFISSLFIFGCKLDVQEDKKLNRPEYEFTSNGVQIRGAYSSTDIEYINIYRQDVTGTTPDPAINIGIIFPSGFDKNDKTYSFIDKEAIESKKYQYFCRYYEGKDGYFYTNPTETITIPSGNGLPSSTTNADLLINLGTSNFIYDSTAKTFTINGTLTLPTHTPAYDLALVIKSSSQTQVFLLEENANITSSMTYSLPSMLPESLLNQQIQIIGLVGQIKEYVNPGDTTSNLKRIYWSPVTTFTLVNTDSPAVSYPQNTITVATISGTNGFDFGY